MCKTVGQVKVKTWAPINVIILLFLDQFRSYDLSHLWQNLGNLSVEYILQNLLFLRYFWEAANLVRNKLERKMLSWCNIMLIKEYKEAITIAIHEGD